MIFTVSLVIDDSEIGLVDEDINTRMCWLGSDVREVLEACTYKITYVAIEHQGKDGHILKYPSQC